MKIVSRCKNVLRITEIRKIPKDTLKVANYCMVSFCFPNFRKCSVLQELETTFPYCAVGKEQFSRLLRPSLRIFEALSFLNFRWLRFTFSVSVRKFIFVLATILIHCKSSL